MNYTYNSKSINFPIETITKNSKTKKIRIKNYNDK